MGSCNVEIEMAGAPSWSAIQKRIKEEQVSDREYRGHQEGYTGDFQTVDDIKDRTDLTFDSYNEAHEYCLNNTEKREAMAVRYRFIDDGKFKYSAKVEKLIAKRKELNDRLNALGQIVSKLPAFKTCEGCQSKVATKHLRGTKCPVCHEGDFRSLSIQRSELKLKTKIELLTKEFETLKKTERDKGLKKFGKVGTLVAGWAAC